MWSGTTYPLKQKWNQILAEETTENAHDFYVIDSVEWVSLRASHLQMKNNRFFKNESKVLINRTATTAIHPFWFLGISLLSLGYLWLHPKLSTSSS